MKSFTFLRASLLGAVFLILIPSEQNYLQFRTQLPSAISQTNCVPLPEYSGYIVVCPQENSRCYTLNNFEVKCTNDAMRLANQYRCNHDWLNFGIIAKTDSREAVTIKASFVSNNFRDLDSARLKIEPPLQFNEETCDKEQELILERNQVNSFFGNTNGSLYIYLCPDHPECF